MSGNLRKPLVHQTTAPSMTPDRMTQSMSASLSPLKIFGNAKRKIREIFVDVEQYIEEAKLYVEGNMYC